MARRNNKPNEGENINNVTTNEGENINKDDVDEDANIPASEEPEKPQTPVTTQGKANELTEEEYLKELVPFYAFKDNDKYKDDILVGVNGKMFQIQRGKDVMIPRYVRNVIEQSMAQDAHTADLIDKQTSAFAAEEKIHNV